MHASRNNQYAASKSVSTECSDVFRHAKSTFIVLPFAGSRLPLISFLAEMNNHWSPWRWLFAPMSKPGSAPRVEKFVYFADIERNGAGRPVTRRERRPVDLQGAMPDANSATTDLPNRFGYPGSGRHTRVTNALSPHLSRPKFP